MRRYIIFIRISFIRDYPISKRKTMNQVFTKWCKPLYSFFYIKETYEMVFFKVGVFTKLLSSFILILFLLINNCLSAQNISSATSGNWNAASTWKAISRTGTVTTSSVSTSVTGTGTSFTTELAVGSILQTTGGSVIGTVASISSNTSLTLVANAASSNTNIAYKAQIVPTSTSTVTISSGHTITVAATANAGAVTLNSSVSSSAINLSGSNTLTITGDLAIDASFIANNNSNAVNVNAGTLTVGGNIIITGGTLNKVANLVLTTGIINLTGNISYAGIAANARFDFGTTGTLNIEGTFATSGGTITTGNGTVNFNGTGAQTIPAFNYSNLSISGARTSNSVTLASSGTIGVSSSFSPTATFTSGTYIITGSTIDYNGTGSETIVAFSYNNLTSSSTGARTFTSSGTINIAGIFTTGTNSYTVTGSTVNFNGTSSAYTFRCQQLQVRIIIIMLQ